MPARQRWMGMAGAVAVIALLLWGIWPESNSKNAVATVTVTTGNIAELVTAQGKLEPKEYVDVGTQVSGQLKKLLVELGDDVSANQLIAEIDPTVYQSRVDADQASLRSLRAQLMDQKAALELAGLQHMRNQQLISASAISPQEFDTSTASLKQAKAKVASLQAQIEQSESGLKGDVANLSYTKIYAPISGTVVAQSTREGQTVNASQSAPTIVQVANLDVMTVKAQVAEADVMRINPGVDVYFTTLGALDKKWRGTVRQILPTPEVVNDVVLYDVLIDADNRDRQLMTGMSTQVFFEVGKADNVPVLPVSALGRRDAAKDSKDGQAYHVRVLVNGKPADRVVQVGLMDRTNAEIKQGLNAGDVVVSGVKTTAATRTGTSGTRGMGMGGGPRL